jgi:hypothetical protein
MREHWYCYWEAEGYPAEGVVQVLAEAARHAPGEPGGTRCARRSAGDDRSRVGARRDWRVRQEREGCGVRNRIAERFWHWLFWLWSGAILNPFITLRRRLFRNGYPPWAAKAVKFQKRLERIRWAIYNQWEPHFFKLPRELKNRYLDGDE